MKTGLPLRFAGSAKNYGAVSALKPTDLEIRDGEFMTLLGPSGSGKTTLLNLAAGYLEPSAGRIFIGERDVTNLPARQRNIGMVFQNYALFPHMSVADNVAYGLAVRRLPKPEILRRVTAALALVRLENYGARRIQELSGGQQQRVALARAIVIEPDVLLMDEPLGALDKQLRRQVQLELRRLHEEHRRTTVYVTHDQEEALVLSDRVAVMRDGSIEQLGTAAELYDEPVNAFVAGFIGESNLLPAKVVSVSGAEAQIDIAAFGQSATVPAAKGLKAGDDARLLIRPEHVLIDREPDGVDHDEFGSLRSKLMNVIDSNMLARDSREKPVSTFSHPALDAEIAEVVYLGELTAFNLRLATGETLWGRQITDRSLKRGMSVKASWKRASARIVPRT